MNLRKSTATPAPTAGPEQAAAELRQRLDSQRALDGATARELAAEHHRCVEEWHRPELLARRAQVAVMQHQAEAGRREARLLADLRAMADPELIELRAELHQRGEDLGDAVSRAVSYSPKDDPQQGRAWIDGPADPVNTKVYITTMAQIKAAGAIRKVLGQQRERLDKAVDSGVCGSEAADLLVDIQRKLRAADPQGIERQLIAAWRGDPGNLAILGSLKGN